MFNSATDDPLLPLLHPKDCAGVVPLVGMSEGGQAMTGTRADVRVAADLIDAFAATITEWPEDSLGGHALAYAHHGWPVLPLHPWDCSCRGCSKHENERGKRPLTLHGVNDATLDLNLVAGWWERWPTANIGLRVPAGVVVIDIDPRAGGADTWDRHHLLHNEPVTRTAVSGRGDGGRHLYYAHPGGKLAGRLGAGVDVKTAGYVVAPPSRHATTGNPYRWVDVAAPIVSLPDHLTKALRPVQEIPIPTTTSTYDGDSIADWYSSNVTWGQILKPHGWELVDDDGDGDSDRSVWKHPTASHATSATIRHGCLFVYSTNTPFEPTDEGRPNGYTRFRAFAILGHRGDLSAAARAAAAMRGAA